MARERKTVEEIRSIGKDGGKGRVVMEIRNSSGDEIANVNFSTPIEPSSKHLR